MNPYYGSILYNGPAPNISKGSSISYYPRTRTFDLRREMHDFLFGNYEEAGKGRPLLLRRIKDQKCVCWDPVTSSSNNPACRYCTGEGFLWTETLETGYVARNFGSVLNPAAVISSQDKLNMAGYGDENRALAFFEFSVFPNYERYTIPTHPTNDSLYELRVDPDGTMTRPVVRVAKWQIRSVTPHQGDNGRVEYFECGLDSESL